MPVHRFLSIPTYRQIGGKTDRQTHYNQYTAYLSY